MFTTSTSKVWAESVVAAESSRLSSSPPPVRFTAKWRACMPAFHGSRKRCKKGRKVGSSWNVLQHTPSKSLRPPASAGYTICLTTSAFATPGFPGMLIHSCRREDDRIRFNGANKATNLLRQRLEFGTIFNYPRRYIAHNS